MSRKDFTEMRNKIGGTLAGWKAHILSKAGKVVLIESPIVELNEVAQIYL